MKQSLTIVHLYPVEMNIYGDRGNVLALCKRLEWRGIGSKVVEVGIGDSFDLSKADIIFSGGGQDRGQLGVGVDLRKRADNLREAVDRGVVVLTVCGAYQLFGRGFTTAEGDRIDGIGIFGAETLAGPVRMIGNIVVESPWGSLVGFENHSGATTLDQDQPPIGRVLKGFGNNPTSGFEGAATKNAFGTYLHGSLLPKNPRFADHLLRSALIRRYGSELLEPLDDRLENRAAEVAAARPQ
jgi:CobQ-like glutamine amidotransferase family enzyme